MRRRLIGMVCWLVCAAVPCAAQTVKLTRGESAVTVTIDGTEFTTLRTATSQPKPFFHPVRAADGISLVRPLENPEDHPHHKGVWCSIDEVNGIKFWAEKGKIVNKSVELVTPEGNPARLKLVNHWLGEQGTPLLEETVDVWLFANRLLIYDATFRAHRTDVTFEDTKEGLFGIRVADTLRGKQGGRIRNAEGQRGEKECWGLPSRWVDYSGTVEGKVKGVTLLDHPGNFRASRYHVRDYGLFTLSPFGQKAYTNGTLPAAPHKLAAGETFRLRYGLYVHDGEAEVGPTEAVYKQFVEAVP